MGTNTVTDHTNMQDRCELGTCLPLFVFSDPQTRRMGYKRTNMTEGGRGFPSKDDSVA